MNDARVFDWRDPAARAHFVDAGYVVVSGVLDAADLADVEASWGELVSEAAARVSLDPDRFEERFPQNRDLWRKDDRFRRLLFATSQGEVARRFLGTRGARLFHDHAICKPARRSGTIPWHQDSAYWPLDRVGLSLWTPVCDVPRDGGCLKVLAGSHRDGPGEPQDFLAGGGAGKDGDARLVRLAVRRGHTVILHGLTWHGSDPNESAVDRLAYLTLWVPATARFVPDRAGWHPTAAHIQVEAGARLEGEWFPLFGEVAEADEGEPVVFPPPSRAGGPSMFTASKDVARQIAWLQGRPPDSLVRLLDGEGARRTVALAREGGFLAGGSEASLLAVLDDLVLQERVRRESVARDVYLVSVTHWWQLVGHRLAEAMREA